VVLLLVLMLGAGDAAAAEPKKFTLINVALDGTKIWLFSSLMVHQGRKWNSPSSISWTTPMASRSKMLEVEEVVQPKAQTTVKFYRLAPGAHSYICHIHPPHIEWPDSGIEPVGP
jgi:hypothetical protein